jgi:mannose-6-phosphate isomerase
MQRICGIVRNYPWSGTYAIADSLGLPPSDEPKAELWLGVHPDSPSLLQDGSTA